MRKEEQAGIRQGYEAWVTLWKNDSSIAAKDSCFYILPSHITRGVISIAKFWFLYFYRTSFWLLIILYVAFTAKEFSWNFANFFCRIFHFNFLIHHKPTICISSARLLGYWLGYALLYYLALLLTVGISRICLFMDTIWLISCRA